MFESFNNIFLFAPPEIKEFGGKAFLSINHHKFNLLFTCKDHLCAYLFPRSQNSSFCFFCMALMEKQELTFTSEKSTLTVVV